MASLENFTEILIDTVRNYPVLYDTTHADYKNNRIKNKIWDNIAEIVGESDGDKLKNKWKNLRDAYSKHLRSKNTHTGQAAKLVVRYKTWPWIHQMSFLRPYLEFAPTQSNIKIDLEQASTSYEETETSMTNVNSPSSPHQHSRRRKASQHTETSMTDVYSPPSPHQHSRRRKASQQNESQVDKVIDFLHNRRNTDFDDVDLVFLGYAKTIKKMSKSRQAKVKFMIAKVIMESELEQDKESTPINTTHNSPGEDTNGSTLDYDFVSSPPEPAAFFTHQEDEPHTTRRPETTSASYDTYTQNQQPTYVNPRQYTIRPTKLYYEQFGRKS